MIFFWRLPALCLPAIVACEIMLSIMMSILTNTL